jgi:hypothetical protein
VGEERKRQSERKETVRRERETQSERRGEERETE